MSCRDFFRPKQAPNLPTQHYLTVQTPKSIKRFIFLWHYLNKSLEPALGFVLDVLLSLYSFSCALYSVIFLLLQIYTPSPTNTVDETVEMTAARTRHKPMAWVRWKEGALSEDRGGTSVPGWRSARSTSGSSLPSSSAMWASSCWW